jgi:bifunctional DNA-binding transcriptional regulator/antitoxin component of YhaV-PrlF toxin-antitoxin module
MSKRKAEPFKAPVVSMGRITLPVTERRLRGIEEGDYVVVTIERHMRLNLESGFFEEVHGASDACPEASVDAAEEERNPLSLNYKQRPGALDDLYGEEDPKRKRESGED